MSVRLAQIKRPSTKCGQGGEIIRTPFGKLFSDIDES